MKPLFLLFAGIVSAGILFSTTSCEKDTDCRATVKCIDSASVPQSDVQVLLYALVKSPDGKTTYTADLQASGNTGSEGTVSFTFKLPAIYDIKATKVIGTQTLSGAGIIKLEEGKNVDKTVILR